MQYLKSIQVSFKEKKIRGEREFSKRSNFHFGATRKVREPYESTVIRYFLNFFFHCVYCGLPCPSSYFFKQQEEKIPNRRKRHILWGKKKVTANLWKCVWQLTNMLH